MRTAPVPDPPQPGQEPSRPAPREPTFGEVWCAIGRSLFDGKWSRVARLLDDEPPRPRRPYPNAPPPPAVPDTGEEIANELAFELEQQSREVFEQVGLYAHRWQSPQGIVKRSTIPDEPEWSLDCARLGKKGSRRMERAYQLHLNLMNNVRLERVAERMRERRR